MMSRLAEINIKMKELFDLRDEDNSLWFNKMELFWSDEVPWLIEQAEREEKLQDQIDNKILPEIEKGWTENIRFREALEFYSKESNYSGYLTAGGWVKTPINDDNGETARQALKGESE